MGQKLYLECYSGISGDMTVAALSGLMKDRTPLFCVLDHMPVEGFSYELKQVKKSGIDAWDFLVKLDAEHENHDHDMEYLHGHSHTHDHDHHHGHEHHQDHAETAGHHHDPAQAEAMHAQEETGHEEHHHHHHEHEHNHDHAALAGLTEGSKEYQDAHERAHATDIQRRFAGKEVTNGQILLFGLTGGLIPCPAAITVLLICIQLKAFTLGATMVLCFSLGLALTLVTVGVGAAISVQQAAKRWSGFNTLARKAPYFSSVLIAMVGLYMGIHGYMGIVG